METIILVRHGQAEHNLGHLTGGWSQTALTELGRRQVELLAARLKKELDGIDYAFYSSDIRRAVETAKIIADAIGQPPEPEESLREFNNGIAADKTTEEAAIHFVEPTDPLIDWQPYPGAETWRRFYARVAGFMDRLHAEEERPVLIVSHGGTIGNIVAWWIRLEMETLSNTAFPTSPASLTVLKVTSLNERALERLSDSAHLYEQGLSPPLPVRK